MTTYIEYPARGTTYCEDRYGVYGYDEYPRGSVLEGQTRRRFLGSYSTLEEAQRAHPQTEVSGSRFNPPTTSHLPGEEL